MSQTDQQHMRRALRLARWQAGRTGKNPAVGCVIVSVEGQVLSEGATGDGGTCHAEQLALGSLAPGVAGGATAYVTLEPCRERSAGGMACSGYLLEAGIGRLVCAVADPHPKGAGGFDKLRAGGVQVEVGLMQAEAEALYADFFANLQDAE